MENKVILIVIAVVLLVAGIALGVLYQGIVGTNQAQKTKQLAGLIDALSSDVVPSVAVYGKVTFINGRNISVTYNQKTVSVHIKEGTPIYSSAGTDATGKLVKNQVDISELKNGDDLSINAKILPDGTLEAQMVLILSS